MHSKRRCRRVMIGSKGLYIEAALKSSGRVSRKSGIVGVLTLKDPVMRDIGFCCEPAYVEKTAIQTVDERNTGVRRKTDPTGKSDGNMEKIEDHRDQNIALLHSNQNVEWVGHLATDDHFHVIVEFLENCKKVGWTAEFAEYFSENLFTVSSALVKSMKAKSKLRFCSRHFSWSSRATNIIPMVLRPHTAVKESHKSV